MCLPTHALGILLGQPMTREAGGGAGRLRLYWEVITGFTDVGQGFWMR